METITTVAVALVLQWGSALLFGLMLVVLVVVGFLIALPLTVGIVWTVLRVRDGREARASETRGALLVESLRTDTMTPEKDGLVLEEFASIMASCGDEDARRFLDGEVELVEILDSDAA